jgi:hypothetical protein
VKRVLVLATAVAALLVPAAPASAGLLDGCGERALERPFLRFLDPLAYSLVPGGTFEGNGPAWSLTGGAKIVDGNESFKVHGTSDSKSLSLPAGSSATSPPVCIHLLDPTVRFFGVNNGSLLSLMRIDVLYTDAGGRQRTLLAGVAPGTGTWLPTLPYLFLQNALQVLSLDGLTTEVRFRFTPTSILLGSGKWRIDDVYVDPLKIW